MRRATLGNGFTLIETVLTITIVAMIAVLAYSTLWGKDETAGAEKTLGDAAGRIAQKRDEAIRLNGQKAATSFNNFIAPLVEVDFGSLETTASLIIDGTDNDGDQQDDYTEEYLTHLRDNRWVYSYRNDALELSAEWEVYLPDSSRMPVPLISKGHNGCGAAVNKIGMDDQGRIYAFEQGEWRKFPVGAPLDLGNSATSPFWAIYFIKKQNRSGIGTARSSIGAAVAIAVYPSGQIEKFRFNGERWSGYKGRTVGCW